MLIRSGIKSPIRSGIASTQGAGVSYDASASELFARFSSPPNDLRKQLISNAIAALKTANLWTGISVLQVYAAADTQAALLNWKSTSFNGTATVAPTFTADRGYTGNNSTQYIDVGVAPSGVSGWTETSATIAAWNLTAGVSNSGYLLGLIASGAVLIQQRLNTTGVVVAHVNSSTDPSATSATILGLHSATRRAAGDTEVYINGATVGNFDPTAGTGAPSASNFATHRSNAAFGNRQIGLVCIAGAAWTDADHTAFYNAMLPYMQGVGAA